MLVLESNDMIGSLALASGSQRRRELLSWLEIPFTVNSTQVNEDELPLEEPSAYVTRLAKAKARTAKAQLSPNTWVLAADTTVVLEGQIIGKPADQDDAARILCTLRGKTHTVFTGLCLVSPEGQSVTDLAAAQVPMRNYTDQEMQAYIASGDPLDKAGAYAIQHREFHPVENFHHCFACVVGLPFCNLARSFRALGATLPHDFPVLCRTHFDYDCPVSANILIEPVAISPQRQMHE